MDEGYIKWLPLFWQVGGSVIAAALYALGWATIIDAGSTIAFLAFATAAYLSLVVRDRRREDWMAIAGYLLYSAGFAFLTAPSFLGDDALSTPARTLGVLFVGLAMAAAWVLYIEQVPDDDSETQS